MIDLANMTENSTLLDLEKRVRALECNGIASTSVMNQNITKPAPIASPMPQPISKPVQQIQPQAVEKAEAPKQVASQEEFTPPPISKKPSGNDINSLWQMLLMNIKSSPTVAMLKQLAKPLEISPSGIVLTVKNERLVSQINDTNKKQVIIEAANVMFNQDSTPVTVRLAQAGDKVVQPTSVPVTQTVQPQVTQTPALTQTVPVRNETPVDNLRSQTEEMNAEKIDRLETDQEKMVLELFDGKYVE